jgi:hypothetical protein
VPAPNYPIDFIAFAPDGHVVLLAEAKSRHRTSEVWAAKFRRNILHDGVLPQSKYFLIATPDRLYGWNQENLSASDVPPQFTIDARETLAPYFAKWKLDPGSIGPEAFDLLVLSWLTDISQAGYDNSETDPAWKPLSDSGLLSSMRQAQIEMNPAG